MNKYEMDILLSLASNTFISQRHLAQITRHSLGIVNRSIKYLTDNKYITEKMQLTQKSNELIQTSSPKNAVILAAGFGMRMVPINTETPKGLVEINGEPLIERTISQLHSVGITDISIVVGFMKEQYEYLIDKYNVKLVVNADYSAKNNLHSIKLVLNQISNTYIIPCDIWCKNNPYKHHELYSWYMVNDSLNSESTVKVNRKYELVSIPDNTLGNTMLGICYLTSKSSPAVQANIAGLCSNSRYNDSFWEEALYCNKEKMLTYANIVSKYDAVEINTYEQLREIDSNSDQLKTEAISVICTALNVQSSEITNISALKKGMTNRSFLFTCHNQKYIMRIPGEGTDKLINRKQEADVYHTIKSRHICDDIIYINPVSGYKITKFLNNARTCDPNSISDLKKCMSLLRKFHESCLTVKHEFDIFKQINFYEHLWNGNPSMYRDYAETKKKIFDIKKYIEKYPVQKVLTHIDAIPDNFLFAKDETGNEDIRLIDWEYSGMQDPLVDIAMFCIYSLYNKTQIDTLISLYFPEGCTFENRVKIYCYIAACGLLWSNWCEYKHQLGIEFGEYSLRQYRYAKDYYLIVQNELKNKEA